MFLFIMLSFAIISEVSAVDDAEISGTGHDPSIKTNIRNHNIAGESNDDGFMQNHENDIGDYFSHNEQKSFNQPPRMIGDKNSDENLYEYDGDVKSNGDVSFDSNEAVNNNQNNANDFRQNNEIDAHRDDNNAMDFPRDSRVNNNHVMNLPGDFNVKNQKDIDLPSDVNNQKKMNIPMDNVSFIGNNQKAMDLPKDDFNGLNDHKTIGFPKDNFSDIDKKPLDVVVGNMSGMKPMDLPRDNFSDIDKKPLDVVVGNMSGMKPMDLPRDNFSGVKPLDVVVGNMSGMKPVGNSDVKPIDLRDNNNAAVLNGEAMNNVMSKLIGLDKIAPNFNLSKTVNNPKYDNSKPEITLCL